MDYFLADDLSGALDAAAAFHAAGRRVRIVLDAAAWEPATGDDVVGITTETRNAPGDAAARVVRDVIQRAQARGGRLLYKKIDSTMRGPVAAELAAVAAAMPGVRILFTPANPRVGRTVRDGELRVNGVPVADTEFARDPVCPVRDSSIARLLGSVPAQVTVGDAETEQDLAAAVDRFAAAQVPWVGVGSGALARPIAGMFRRADAPTRLQTKPIPPTAVLLLGGSAHPKNRQQAAALGRAHDVNVLTLDPLAVAASIAAGAAELRAGRSVALLLPEARMDSAVALGAMAAAGRLLAEGLGRVFATGGETAFAFCGAVGVRALHFEKELEPGLVLARGESRAGPLLLAVKPGGFGDEQTWIRAWTELGAAR
jgi:uncharacterized protein YgbK (DUF1537 family)